MTQTTLKLGDPPDLLVPTRASPRVWVRELRLFEDPETLIRRIELRRGLNVVWAPDQARVGDEMGHLAGKSLLCGLLRYVLGEVILSPPQAAKGVARALPAGLVAARVEVGDVPWWVVRAFGDDQLHAAHQHEELGELHRELQTDDRGWRSYRAALAATLRNAGSHMEQPWLLTLEWIARDEVCHSQVLQWREKEPTTKRTRATLVRALLDLPPVAREKPKGNEASDSGWLEKELGAARGNAARLLGEAAGAGRTVGSMPTEVLLLRRELEERLAATQPSSSAPSALVEAVGVLRQRETLLDEVRRQAAGERARADERKKALSESALEVERLRRQREGLVLEGARLCPECEQLINQPEDIEEHDAKLASRVEEAERGQRELREAYDAADCEASRLEAEGSGLEQEVARLRDALEQLRTNHQATLYDLGRERNRIEHRLARLDDYEAECERIEEINRALQKPPARGEPTDSGPVVEPPDPANQQAWDQALQALTEQLFGDDAFAETKLTPAGFEIAFFEPGRSPTDGASHTPSFDAVGVLAFDLAALRMAIADRADLPGFWIHDNPRRGIGAGRYEAYENALLALQEHAGEAFQFLLTTTDEPGPELRQFVVPDLRLGSGDDESLLLRRRF